MDDELSQIEARLDAYAALIAAADVDAEIQDYVAMNQASWTLASRIKATTGLITCSLPGDQFIKGWVRGVGLEHVELTVNPDSAMLHAVVRLATCRTIGPLAGRQQQLPAVPRTFGAALRSFSVNETRVSCVMATGGTLTGHVVSVYADHIDLWSQTQRTAVPSTAIAAVIAVG